MQAKLVTVNDEGLTKEKGFGRRAVHIFVLRGAGDAALHFPWEKGVTMQEVFAASEFPFHRERFSCCALKIL